MMLTWKSLIIHSLLCMSLCIQFTVIRSAPHPKSGPGDNMKSPDGQDTVRKDDTKNSDYIIKSFSDILHHELKNSGVLISLFSKPMDVELVATIASAIADSLVIEAGLIDSYSAANLIIEALLSVTPSKGPEAYCKALITVVGEILLSNEILNFGSYFALANIVSQIILNSASDVLIGKKNSGLEDGIEAELVAELNAASSTGLDVADRTGRSTAGVGGNVFDPRLDTANLDFRPDTGLSTTADLDFRPDTGFSTTANLDFRPDTGLSTTANLDANVDVNSLLGVDTNLDFLLGNNLNSDADMEANIDLSASKEANLQFKSELTNKLLRDRTFRNVFCDNVPPSALRQIIAAVCQYISKAFAISRSFLLPLENSIGNLSLDSTPCPELYSNIIAERLTNLFSSINLITNDTASLQATIAANAITSGITSFIRMSTIPGVGFSINENPFNSYFSALNGLEKLHYVGVEAISPKLPPALTLTYSSRFSSQFANILFYNLVSSSKFLEVFWQGVPTFINKIVVKSLGKFVAEAFGSSNPKSFYDIYCKALLTPAIKLNSLNYAKALSFATARALFLNGYFLSGNINIQAAIAKNAIIRALTTKTRPVTTQVALFPNILRLPWITQLNGVLPSQILLKYGIARLNAGADAGVGLRLDESIDTRMNSALGAGVRVNTGLEPGVDINTGASVGVKSGLEAGQGINAALETGQSINTALGVGLGLNAGLGGRQNVNDDLKARQVVNAGLGAGLSTNLGGIGSANAGLRTAQVVNAGMGTERGLNAGLRAGQVMNAGLGAGLSMNSGLGVGMDSNADLGAKIDAGLGTGLINTGQGAYVGSDLGVRAGFGGGLGFNADLGGALGSKAGFESELIKNAGFRAGLSMNSGLGAEMDSNVDLGSKMDAGFGAGLINTGQGAYVGSDLGVHAGFGGGLDFNAAFESEKIRNAGLGAGFGINTGLGAGIDSNIGLGAGMSMNSGLDARPGKNAVSGTGFDVGLGAGLEPNGDLGWNANIRADLNANDDLGDLQLRGLYVRSPQLTMNDDSEVGRFSRKKRSIDDLPSDNIDWNSNFDLDSKNLLDEDLYRSFLAKSKNVKSNTLQKQQTNISQKTEINTAARTGNRFEKYLDVRTKEGLKSGALGGLDIGTDADLNTGTDERFGAESRVSFRTGSYAGLGGKSAAGLEEETDAVLRTTNLGIDTNLGAESRFDDGVHLGFQSTVKGDNSNTQLAILNVLSLILANKLYVSTTLYTSISMVGARKIINLISQAMASEFGFPIATVFLRSYEQYIITTGDDSFEIIMVGLAKATTEALAGTGLLNSKFSVSTAYQLAEAIVIKLSSLIATSLEAKEFAARPQWTYLLSQDLVQPPLIPGYNTYK